MKATIAKSRRTRKLRSATVLVVLAISATSIKGVAEETPPPLPPPITLKVDWTVDGSIAAVSMAAWITSGLLDNQLAPRQCGWCRSNALDIKIRNAVVWSNPHAADTISTVIAATVSLGAVGYALLETYPTGGLSGAGKDLVLIAETIAISGLATEAGKYTVRRARPYVYYGKGGKGGQDNLSFWSGHGAEVFSAVTASSMVARLHGYDDWPWIYAVGFAGAATMTYFRVAADQHWWTDTLGGLAVGTGFGILVPWLHSDSRGTQSFRVIPSLNGLVVAGEF